MACPLRLEFAGALYHVTLRENRREPIFELKDDGCGLPSTVATNGQATFFRTATRQFWLRKRHIYWTWADMGQKARPDPTPGHLIRFRTVF